MFKLKFRPERVFGRTSFESKYLPMYVKTWWFQTCKPEPSCWQHRNIYVKLANLQTGKRHKSMMILMNTTHIQPVSPLRLICLCTFDYVCAWIAGWGGTRCAGAVTVSSCTQCTAGTYQTGTGPPWKDDFDSSILRVCFKFKFEHVIVIRTYAYVTSWKQKFNLWCIFIKSG